MLLKQRLLHLFIALLCLAPLTAQAQNLQLEPQKDCVPVIRVFEKAICKEEIAPDQAHMGAIKEEFAEEGIDPELALRDRAIKRLNEIIWDEALTRKFTQAQLTPTEEEINFYSKTLKSTLSESHRKNKIALEKVTALLEKGGHSEEDTKKLENLKGTLHTSITFYEERESYNAGMPPEFHEMVAEAERNIAMATIREWRINKALYNAFGGRVVLDKNAPIPFDAQRKFIDYVRKEGKLLVLDANYKNLFAETESYLSMLAEKAEANSSALVKGDDYFTSPSWLFSGSSSAEQN